MRSIFSYLITTVILLVFNGWSTAQDELILKSGTYKVEAEGWERFDQQTLNRWGQRKLDYGIIQFETLPGQAEKKKWKALGVEFLAYLPERAYVVRFTEKFDLRKAVSSSIRAYLPIKPEWKISPAVIASGPEVYVSVSIFPGADWNEVMTDIADYFSFSPNPYYPKHIKTGTIRTADIWRLASVPDVMYIDHAFKEPELLREISTGSQRVGDVHKIDGLSGAGVTIGVGDGGAHGNHIDVNHKVRDLTAGFNSGHAAHVIGIVAGEGHLDPAQGRGTAPGADIISQNFNLILDNAEAYNEDYGMVITNNSWGTMLGVCEVTGNYTQISAGLDLQLLDNPEILHVFAAGNDGNRTCDTFPQGYKTIITDYQSSKNALVVGNSNHWDILRGSSSKGPTRDGRLKPEVVAVGTSVRSHDTNNGYRNLTGTSMASPQVAGIAGLLYEQYRNMNGVNPPAGLIKAVIANGADDMGRRGPDYAWGFGRVNAARAVQILKNQDFFIDRIWNGEQKSFEIEIPQDVSQTKVMLYWHDAPGAPMAGVDLVNDLDLSVMNSRLFRPMVLDPSPGGVLNEAQEGVDRLNNIEQVVINAPDAGTATIQVDGFDVPMDSVTFFVVVSHLYEGLKVVNPSRGDIWTSNEVRYVRWDEQLLQGDSLVRVEISLDGGDTWSLITDTIPASQRWAEYVVPAAISNDVIVRVSQPFNGNSAVSDTFSIIPKATIDTLYSSCSGFAYIKWRPVIGIDTYRIYGYDGSGMTELAEASGNEAKVPLWQDGGNWLAVAPVMPNGQTGPRSRAAFLSGTEGVCPGTSEIAITELTSRSFGRKHTSLELNENESVSVSISNTGDLPAPLTLAYQLDDGEYIIEQMDDTLRADTTMTFTFTETVDLSAVGTYALKVMVVGRIDGNSRNDTLHTQIRHVDNPALTLPFTEDFESARLEHSLEMSRAVGLDFIDHMKEGGNGRLRLDGGKVFSNSGSHAVLLDAFPSGQNESHFAVMTFNLAGYLNEPGLRMNFSFVHNESDPDDDENDLIWIRGNDTAEWVPVYDIFANYNDAGVYQKEVRAITIPSLLADSGQVLSSSFQVRIGQQGERRSFLPGRFDGYAFDDFEFFIVEEDVRPLEVTFPVNINCQLSIESITVNVENTHFEPIDDVRIRYRINDGMYSPDQLISFEANEVKSIVLDEQVDLSTTGIYQLDILMEHEGDTYRLNDTLHDIEIINIPLIESFPYVEDFEDNDGGWYSTGDNNTWEWGTPNEGFPGAAQGESFWATNLNGNHNDQELSYLMSPCFDLSSMLRPMLSFAHIARLEANYDWGWVEYSVDGEEWIRLGEIGDGYNWYDYNDRGDHVWNGFDKSDWTITSILLPEAVINAEDRVRIRFVMDSDQFVNEYGMAIDLVHVHDYVPIAGIRPGTHEVEREQGSVELIVEDSIMARVTALGADRISAIAYDNAADVLYDSTQLYFPRTWAFQSGNIEQAVVDLFVLEEDIDTLFFRECPLCPDLQRVFDWSVTQFSGLNEDGILWNNFGKDYAMFDTDTQSVDGKLLALPYGRGLKFRLETEQLSEFRLHSGNVSGNVEMLQGGLLDFNTVRQGDSVQITWQAINESELLNYTVERSLDSFENNIVEVLNEPGRNKGLGVEEYSITDDDELAFGEHICYRIKATHANGVFYTPTLCIDLTAVRPPDDLSSEIQIVPNPNNGSFRFFSPADEPVDFRILDGYGRLVQDWTASHSNASWHLHALSPGLYLVETVMNKNRVILRMVVQ